MGGNIFSKVEYDPDGRLERLRKGVSEVEERCGNSFASGQKSVLCLWLATAAGGAFDFYADQAAPRGPGSTAGTRPAPLGSGSAAGMEKPRRILFFFGRRLLTNGSYKLIIQWRNGTDNKT